MLVIFLRALLCLSIAMALARPAFSEDGYFGTWIMTDESLEIDILSWGESCGARLAPYRRKPDRIVEITGRGGHLAVSVSGDRTDACLSSNANLRTISSSRQPGKWGRVCQTPKDDPKFERGEYSFVAKSDDALEVIAVSHVDWILNEDHCKATLKERRVYVRAEQGERASEGALSAVRSKESASVLPGCEEPGPVRWISISPKKTKIEPGESVCFKVEMRDSKGCPVSAAPSWSVMQNGAAVRGPMSASGCFRTGDTAAEAEGRYTVIAKAQGRTASADIEVLFPDLGALASARLDPVVDGRSPVSSSKPPEPGRRAEAPLSPDGEPLMSEIKPDNGTSLPLFIAVISLTVVALASLTYWLVRRRIRLRRELRAEFEDWPEATGSTSTSPVDAAWKSSSVIMSKRCPECGRFFDRDARYCPYDKNALVVSVTSSLVPEAGMICPKCSRGYSVDARFCPHDAEPLMSYEKWRETRDNRKLHRP